MTSLHIETLKQHATEWWMRCSSEYPAYRYRYSPEIQTRKESEVATLIEMIEFPRGKSLPDRHHGVERQEDTTGRIQQAMTELLHCFDCPIDPSMEKQFTDVMEQFAGEAREFDQSIDGESIYQAARNVLIMNTFQMFFDVPLVLTPSIFAYSLLYPYTDNFLDDSQVSHLSKREFVDRLGLRLSGVPVDAQTLHEERVFRLVEIIESEFDRARFPQVFESLVGIHNAQKRSMLQHGDSRSRTEADLLDISVEKGGTSVLADGCLVAGELSPEEAEFFFEFGVLLQLIDDLQDLEEDISRGHHTIFGLTEQDEALDNLTNRLFAFTRLALRRAPVAPSSQRHAALRLIDRGCRLLILEAVACNESYYSTSFLQTTEMCSPVHLEFLRDMKMRLQEGYSCEQRVFISRSHETSSIDSRTPFEATA